MSLTPVYPFHPTSHVASMSTCPVTTAVANYLAAAAEPDERLQPAGREEPAVRVLVDAARAGNREAFGDLVLLYQRVVFRTALAALGSREDAEDAAQDAFVMAWRKLDGFRGDATFRTWLLTIVWRKALDKRRARGLWWSRTERPTWQDDEEPLDAVATAEPSPEDLTVSRDLAARIRRAAVSLSPKLRDALVLAATGEHSYGEIAVMLGIPLGTLKWRVSEARRVLNAKLAE